jgi:hypothetical protein
LVHNFTFLIQARSRSTTLSFAQSCFFAISLLCVACTDNEPKDAAGAMPSRWFTDISDEAGLDFVHEAVADDQLRLPSVMGGGAALFDFDNDGDLDIYLTNGDQVLPGTGHQQRGSNRLYRREADGRYTDVTAGSGLGDTGYGMGVATGDIDNDGWVDVFVSNYGPDRLYRNQGDGTFIDITSAAGAGLDGWSASAAFCDFDRDGYLDLYVTRYVDFQPAKRCTDNSGKSEFCGPKSFRPVNDIVLHNEGAGAGGAGRRKVVRDAAGGASPNAAGPGRVGVVGARAGWQGV